MLSNVFILLPTAAFASRQALPVPYAVLCVRLSSEGHRTQDTYITGTALPSSHTSHVSTFEEVGFYYE